jgi:hypothetical protein
VVCVFEDWFKAGNYSFRFGPFCVSLKLQMMKNVGSYQVQEF